MVQSVPREGAAVPGHSSTKLTYADYVRIPDDGLRHEIIEGEHYVTPAPTTRHQRILRNLSYLVQKHLVEHAIGEMFFAPCDVVLSDVNVLLPDLLFVSNDRSAIITSKNLQGAPSLVVEILSPSTRKRDLHLKRDVYERTGVEEYWVIDPEGAAVDVHVRAGTQFAPPRRYQKAETLTTPLLPGLELPLDKILVE
jgi:Uma2 family endonuclease